MFRIGRRGGGDDEAYGHFWSVLVSFGQWSGKQSRHENANSMTIMGLT